MTDVLLPSTLVCKCNGYFNITSGGDQHVVTWNSAIAAGGSGDHHHRGVDPADGSQPRGLNQATFAYDAGLNGAMDHRF